MGDERRRMSRITRSKGLRRRKRAFRQIGEGEVLGAWASFLMVHSGCAEEVDLFRDGSDVVCWCALCEDIRTFAVQEAL